MGKVYIIGTGPGDEELLTLKAVEALKKCDVVLYDRLVSNNILNYLRPDCEIYYCGKESGAHYQSQEEINNNLIKFAKKGKVVGRIKGGDPYVFGRGGEEVLALRELDIDFEVISGVTSPVAVLNYAGIPITHRGMAQSFHVVTGMSANESKVNFKALAREEGTLVFMMGLSNLGKIVKELVENGKDINTPTAVVMKGTTSKKKKVIGTLENIEERVLRAKLKSPCIIVIGKVVTLNKELSWYENKPLFGTNICITRAKNQSSNLKKKLTEMGADVLEVNSIKIEDTSEKLKKYLSKLEDYNHILFTSVNAVNIFFDYLIKEKYDIRRINAKISVVGKATKSALEARGIQPFTMAKEFMAEGLFKAIKHHLSPDDVVLIPCSAKSKNTLKEQLEDANVLVDRVNIYDTVPGTITNIRAFDDVDIVLFTSPSTVRNMIQMVGLEKIKKKKCIAIGPQTSNALLDNGINALVCNEHSEEGFLNEIIEMRKREV